MVPPLTRRKKKYKNYIIKCDDHEPLTTLNVPRMNAKLAVRTTLDA